MEIIWIIPLLGLWGLPLYEDHWDYGDMGILGQDMFLGAWGEPGLDVFVILLLLFVVARRGPPSYCHGTIIVGPSLLSGNG